MIELLSIIASTTVLTSIGIIYYVFFRQPYKLRKLNKDIKESTSSRQSLLQTVDTLSKDKSQLQTDFAKLKSDKDKLQDQWNKLSGFISSGQKELQTISYEKRQVQTDLQTIKSEIEKLKATIESNSQNAKQTARELVTLTEKKKELNDGIEKMQSEFLTLRKNVNTLSSAKSNLEIQNSELSDKIEEKKNSYRVKHYEVIEEKPREQRRIGYNPINRFGTNFYPFVSMPKPNCRIQFPRKVEKHLLPMGFKDEAFADDLIKHFASTKLGIYTNRILVIASKTNPYEPDIAVQDEHNDLNMFIDVEIDEPYDGTTRYATHCNGVDDYRNLFFNERGWIVIRFSERQVHCFPKECCRVIAEVIKDINPKFSIPTSLNEIKIVASESFWTKVQAERWEKDNYREIYLKHTFPKLPSSPDLIVANNINRNQDEEDIALQNPISFNHEKEDMFGRWWNKLNRHQRDSRIEFFPKPHLYRIDGTTNYVSATTLINRFFKDFDAEKIAKKIEERRGVPKKITMKVWADEGTQAAEDGLKLHRDIEDYFENKIEQSSREFKFFLEFYKNKLGSPTPFRTEWRIFDNNRKVAGTADLVLRKKDGTFAIYDWKRSKEIKRNGHPDFHTKITAKGVSLMSGIEHCNYIHYSLQLNIYKKILEKYYVAKPVTEMYFVQLHPNEQYTSANIYPVPDMQKLVDEMFETTKQ